MKCQVYFAPTFNEHTRVTLTILDKEDFTTEQIFQHPYDYPDDKNYCLFPGNSNFIVNLFTTSSIARRWAETQLAAIRGHLSEWRNPPKDQTKILYL